MSNNVNSTQISALLRLYPMAIPGAETNVLPAGTYHLGIPLSIHSPSIDLYMVIDPVTLLSTSFAVGDSVRLWVNGQATSVIKIIKKGEENDRIEMELPWGSLKDGLNTLYYEVTRVSGNKEKSDPILNVLFNNPASGITVSHPASIGPGQPATFILTRDYPREYDVMTLIVGRWSKTIPYVHPANPVTYTLTSTDRLQIGDGPHPVSATVVDQLSNRDTSPTTSITFMATPPLSVNPSTLDLNGVMVRSLHFRAPNIVDAPMNTAALQVSGGVAPYTFRSSAPQIAQTNAQGKVEGMSNGVAVITITDQNNASVSVSVGVTNIYDLTIFHSTGMTYPLYLQRLAANQWIAMTPQIQAAFGCYNAPALNWTVQPNPLSNFAWTGPANGNSAQAYNGVNGTFAYHNQTVSHPDQGLGFYLKNN